MKKKLLLGILTIIFFNGYSTQSNNYYTEKVLLRAKELLESLPDEEDSYGLKKKFPSARIVSATCQDNKWQLETEIDIIHSMIFVLPKTQDDYNRSGGFDKAIMTTSTSREEDNTILVFILINPQFFQEDDINDINLDYLASCMLHEAVHFYQQSIYRKMKKSIPIDNESIEKREKEAYDFQVKFVDQILKDNNLSLDVKAPKLSMPVLEQMTGERMYLLILEVDRLNYGKLGIGLSSLIVYRQYSDLYLKLFVNQLINNRQ